MAPSGARRLYALLGYEEIAQRPMVKDSGIYAGSNWVLLVKHPVAASG